MTATKRERCIYCNELTWLNAMCFLCRSREQRPAWDAQMEQDRKDRNAATIERMRS